jgi:hypothetical protein
MHAHSVYFKHDFFAQLGLILRISIPEHGFDGRNQSELVQDAGAAHVARVKNELDPS